MGLRVIYKDGKEFACGFSQAKKMVAQEGWSFQPDSTAPKTADSQPKAEPKTEPEVTVLDDSEVSIESDPILSEITNQDHNNPTEE